MLASIDHSVCSSAHIFSCVEAEAPLPSDSGNSREAVDVTTGLIYDISLPVLPVNPSNNLAAVLKRFQTDATLLVLPVVDGGRERKKGTELFLK